MDRRPASPLLHARQLDDQLDTRCALFVWTALVAAVAAGLLAWGPVTAASRASSSVPMAVWVAASIQLMAALVGVAALGAVPWPRPVRRAWRAALAAMAIGAALTAAQARGPSMVLQLAGHGVLILGALWVACGLLADRLHPAWASIRACALAALCVLAACGLCWLSASGGEAPDLRSLWLVAALAVLLLPAGLLSLPGKNATPGDAQLLLGLQGTAVLVQLGDAVVLHGAAMAFTGAVAASWCQVSAATWLAYRAYRAVAPVCVAQAGADEAFTHASTSANT